MSRFKSLGLLALFLSLFAFSAQAQTSPYSVEVKVDVTDVNAAQAREKAMRSAYRQAFETVLKKLVSTQDAATLSAMTDDQMVNFIQEVGIVSEKASDVRYIATLQVTINKAVLNAYLREKEIQTAVADKSKIIIIPIYREFEADGPLLWEQNNLWMQAWLNQPVADSLYEIEAIPQTAVSKAEISAEQAQAYDAAALQEVALNNNANDVYVADAFFDGIEGLKITLTSLKSDRAAEVILVRGDRNNPQVLLATGVEQVRQHIGNKIKNANLAQSRMQTTLPVLYNFDKLADWVKVEKLIKSIPYTKNLQVDAMGNGKVQFRVDMVGTDDRIWNAFRNKGLNLKQYDNFYLLEY